MSLPVAERPESHIKLSYLIVSLSYSLRQHLSGQNLTLSTRLAVSEPLGSSYLPVLNPHQVSPSPPVQVPQLVEQALYHLSHLLILQDFLFVAQAVLKLVIHPCQCLISPGPSTLPDTVLMLILSFFYAVLKRSEI